MDTIVEELWGEGSPATARHMVEVYVSRLRKVVGDGVVLTRVPGYVLQFAAEQVDIRQFERLLAEGSESLAVGNPATAAARLGEALALWRDF